MERESLMVTAEEAEEAFEFLRLIRGLNDYQKLGVKLMLDGYRAVESKRTEKRKRRRKKKPTEENPKWVV